jgi:hypothetical protein
MEMDIQIMGMVLKMIRIAEAMETTVNKEFVPRLQKAFDNSDEVAAANYQKVIEDNLSKVAESAERLTIRLLTLIMVFILIIQGVINKIEFGGVEIDKLQSILITLPILIAYTHYDAVTTLSKFDRLSIIHKVIIQKRHKSIYNQRLTEYFLHTPNLFEYKYFSTHGIMQGIQFLLWALQFLSITIFIPIGFQACAYFYLFTQPLIESQWHTLLNISLVITSLFSLQSFLTTVELLGGLRNK